MNEEQLNIAAEKAFGNLSLNLMCRYDPEDFSAGFKSGYSYRDGLPIKELVWEKKKSHYSERIVSKTPIGQYEVAIYQSGDIVYYLPNKPDSIKEQSIEAAKSACNQHFQNIVKSLLEL